MLLEKYGSTNFIIGLRAVAMLTVFLIHSGGAMPGVHGVQIFFVISGFTIFYQFYERDYTFKKFIFTRLARISIPYFPIIILIYLYINNGGEIFDGWTSKFANNEITIENLLLHLSYLSGYSVKYANTIIGVEWTLPVEVFYYFVIGGFISLYMFKLKIKKLLILLVFFIIVSLIVLYLSHMKIYDHYLMHWMPFRHGWFFILGGIAFYLRKYISIFKKKYLFSDISIIIAIVSTPLLLKFATLTKINYASEAIIAVITFLLITFVNDKANLTKLLTNKPMLFLGNISYSFYLIHIIVIYTHLVDKIYVIDNQILVVIVNFIVTVLISYVWYKSFEDIIYKRVKYYIKFFLSTEKKNSTIQ